MIILLLLLTTFLTFAQEIELTTNNVQVYARVKNCIDFYLCSPYEETLKIDNGYYHWKAQFKEPLSSIQKAFDDCSVGNLKFDLTVRDENGMARKDFRIMQSPMPSDVSRYLLPMELYPRTYEGLKLKEKSVDTLLQSRDALPAMKTTSFEMEYPLGEYHLAAQPIAKSNVLATTHHLKKLITYDLDKWDGSTCRFYEVMRHEIQHVRNYRKRLACKNRHHFSRGNHDERSTYLNDLVFLKTYCPENKSLYKNVETILLMMYQNKDLQTCGVGEDVGSKDPGEGNKPKSEPKPDTRKDHDFFDNFFKSRFKSPIRYRPHRTPNPNALH